MRTFPLALLACATALAISPAALVAQSWNFTYNDGTVVATGTLTGTEIGSTGTYDVESGTITLVGGPVVGSGTLDPDPNAPGGVYTYQNPPNSGGANFTIDNVFSPNSNPQLDGYGLLFTVDNIPVSIANSLYGGPPIPNSYVIFEGNWLYVGVSPTFVPEGGASLLYLLIGGGVCFGAMTLVPRSRFSNPASV